MEPQYTKALEAIDFAHAQDPTQTTTTTTATANGEEETLPNELHYANQMTSYLTKHTPSASPILQIAVRAQHLRRWEVPRNTYPATKAGYFSWRTGLGRRQAEIARGMCLESGMSEDEADRVAALVRKEDLRRDAETQVLEDVACLVFLDGGLEEFEKGFDGGEEKVVSILRKTWGKMSERGRELALGIGKGRLRVGELVSRALS